MSDYDPFANGLSQVPPPFDSSLNGPSGVPPVAAPLDMAGATSDRAKTSDLSRWDEQGRTDSAAPTLPAAGADLSPSSGLGKLSSDNSSSDDGTRHVAVIFRDALDLPIERLDMNILLPDGSVFTSTTTAHGAVTLPVLARALGSVLVRVRDTTGALQLVCSLDLAKCYNAVIVRSPKVAVKGALRQHQQTPPTKLLATKPPVGKLSTSPSRAARKLGTTSASAVGIAKFPSTGSLTWWSDNGALAQAWKWVKSEIGVGDTPPAAAPLSPVQMKALSAAGQPVTFIAGPECPNPDKLRLGRNNVFRDAILHAAKRLGLIPQALCALMDCEAGKVTEHIPKLSGTGKPLLDKEGTPLTTIIRELWNANAGNTQSGAAGLTQFLGSTWLGHVLIPGRYIHDQSMARGWVRQETSNSGKTAWAFVLSNGTTRAHVATSDHLDANVCACLAMRMNPVWSINAAADYGAANLIVLQAKSFNLGGLTDMNKAKLMYLMHHEGEGSGPLFIRNTLGTSHGGVEGLRRKFVTQLGRDGTAASTRKISAANGDVELAYRAWLSEFIDRNFNGTAKYFCSSPQDSDTLSDIMVLIGGEKISTVL